MKKTFIIPMAFVAASSVSIGTGLLVNKAITTNDDHTASVMIDTDTKMVDTKVATAAPVLTETVNTTTANAIGVTTTWTEDATITDVVSINYIVEDSTGTTGPATFKNTSPTLPGETETTGIDAVILDATNLKDSSDAPYPLKANTIYTITAELLNTSGDTILSTSSPLAITTAPATVTTIKSITSDAITADTTWTDSTDNIATALTYEVVNITEAKDHTDFTPSDFTPPTLPGEHTQEVTLTSGTDKFIEGNTYKVVTHLVAGTNSTPPTVGIATYDLSEEDEKVLTPTVTMNDQSTGDDPKPNTAFGKEVFGKITTPAATTTPEPILNEVDMTTHISNTILPTTTQGSIPVGGANIDIKSIAGGMDAITFIVMDQARNTIFMNTTSVMVGAKMETLPSVTSNSDLIVDADGNSVDNDLVTEADGKVIYAANSLEFTMTNHVDARQIEKEHIDISNAMLSATKTVATKTGAQATTPNVTVTPTAPTATTGTILTVTLNDDLVVSKEVVDAGYTLGLVGATVAGSWLDNLMPPSHLLPPMIPSIDAIIGQMFVMPEIVAPTSDGLSGGAIAGIVIGSLAGVALLGAGGYWVYTNKFA